VNTNPTAGGAVQLVPAPNGPNGTYLDGTIVTITAEPAFGFSFSNWSGSVAATTNPLVLTMDADRIVTANFISTPVTAYVLTLITNPVGAGTITVSPAPNAPGGAYVAGTLVTLTATALTTNAFTNWTGDVLAASNRVTIAMDGNKTAIANFVPIIPPRFHLTIGISPTNGGHVLVTPSADTNATYAVNTTVALAALPEHGFRFSQWSGATSSTNNPIVLTITADTAITAQFEPVNALDFAALAGSYTGLALNENRADHAASGTLNLRVAKTGTYRGTALLGGARQPVAGQFDRFGYAPLVFRRGTLSGSLQVDPAAARITGILTDGQKSPGLLLYRVGVASNAATFAGTYAITLGTNGPISAESAATLVVRENGSVRIRGQLADGAKFSGHTTLTSDARVPLAAMLYGKAGSLLGWLNLTTNFTVEGTALWSRPADSRSRDFPEGFAIQVPVSGARQ
jgi:hypothetical protein